MSWLSAIVDKGGEQRRKPDPCSHFLGLGRLLDEKDSSRMGKVLCAILE